MKTAISLVALAVLTIAVLWYLNDVGIIDFAFMVKQWPTLVQPALLALFATVVSYVIGFMVAIPFGLVRAFGPGTMKRGGTRGSVMVPMYGVITGYVQAFRGTPVFVQILLLHDVITAAFPKVPSIELWSGILALTLNTIGYQTEVFRAGFQSVTQGQIEAAKSIGMNAMQTFFGVTLPQGLRLIILPLVNEWIGLFKASALLWAIAVTELMWRMDFLGANLNHPVEGFLMGSVFYLAIIIPLSRTTSYIEAKKRIPGLGVPTEVGRKRAFWMRTAPSRPA